MPLKRRTRRIHLMRRWTSPDWDYTPWGYRFLKTTFNNPVKWVAKLNVKGAHHVPAEGPALLAINHFSWADPIVMAVPLKRPAFYLAKESLFRNPVLRSFLEAHGQIKVDRQSGSNDPAVDKACEILAQGLIVGVFPEATRSRPGEVKRGKTGVARIALRSGVPIVPVAMTTDDFWPKDRATFKAREAVYVNVGEPMRVKGDSSLARDRQFTRDLTDDIMERVRALLDEAYAAKGRGETWD